jgi:hypothetical protein
MPPRDPNDNDHDKLEEVQPDDPALIRELLTKTTVIIKTTMPPGPPKPRGPNRATKMPSSEGKISRSRAKETDEI